MNRKNKVMVYGKGSAGLRLILIVIGLLTICGLSFLLKSEGRKNVLLIVVDTLRADHLGCYGHDGPTTPHVDALSKTGTLFTRYYTVVPSTLASVTTCLTSLYPKDHGSCRNGFKIDESLPVLGEVFQRAGYETSAFISSYCLSSEFGMNRGFDHFDENFNKGTALEDNKLIRSAKFVTGDFLSWLLRRRSEKPFFSMVHYFDPHWPYTPGQGLRNMFKAHKLNHEIAKYSFVMAQKNLTESGGVPGEFEQNMHRLYCAEVRGVDNQIQKIMDVLSQRKLLEDTIVVITADHGQTFWDHDDYFNHGLGVYDSTLHIPLIIINPGNVPAGKRCDATLSNLDLAPTLCDLAGIEPPAGFQGRSFKPILLGDARPGDETPCLFAEATRPPAVEEGAERPNLLKAKCIRRGGFKFITVPYYKPAPRRELYNLDNDPGERENLIDDEAYTDLIKEMERRLDSWANTYRSRSRRDAFRKDAENKLNQLGY